MPIENVLNIVKTGGKGYIKNILKQMGVEATEETASTVLNHAADVMANDPEAKLSLKDLVLSAVGSALSAIGFAVGSTALHNGLNQVASMFPRLTRADGSLGLNDGGHSSTEANASIKPVQQDSFGMSETQARKLAAQATVFQQTITKQLGELNAALGQTEQIAEPALKAKRMTVLQEKIEQAGARLQKLEKNKQQLVNAQLVAERLGVKLQLADLGPAGGRYENGAITLNPYSDAPVQQVLVHELTHHLETSGGYGALRNHVNSYISEYLKTDMTALQDEVRRECATKGVLLDAEGASREVVAKFCESRLFQDETSILHLAQTDQPLFQRIRNWVHSVSVRLRGTAQEKSMLDIARLYEKAARSTGEQTGYGQTQNRIMSLPNGEKYVQADRQVFFDNDPEMWKEQIEIYIAKHITKGGSITLETEDGDILTLNNSTVGKSSFWNSEKDKNGVLRKISEEAYETKLNAEAHIDELAQISKRGARNFIDNLGVHGDMAKNVWNYRTAFFRDFDGQHYRLKISVAQGKDGNVVYNLANIRKRAI